MNECVTDCITETISKLPEKYRQAIELTDLMKIPQLELSQKLNLSYSGTKSRVQRARQMVKQRMVELYNIKFDAYGNVVVCENRTPCGCG